ncbi:MAG: exo-alpha-sialidase [Opitutales bacterium]
MTEKDPLPTSPITNRWEHPKERRSLALTETILYRGTDQAAYNHHPQLCYHHGSLFATWSNGYRDEDVPGQRSLIAESRDLGRTWSQARPLVDRLPGEHRHGIVTNGGILSHAEGLTAYYAYYDRTYTGMLMYYAAGGNGTLGQTKDRSIDPEKSYVGSLTSTDGRTWTETPHRVPKAFLNLSPEPLPDGSLLLPGFATHLRTTDPRGVEGWQRSGLPGLFMDESDDTEGHLINLRQAGYAQMHHEASFFVTDDGVIHLMMRTGQPWLSVSESRDNGATWSRPARTRYTDAVSKNKFGRLPDGRFYGLTTPEPKSPRTPLVLAISEDGIRFGRHFVIGDQPNFLARLPGMHKYGRYGYPHLCLAEDQVCIIYSINKEDIAFVRFPLKELA